MADRVTTKTKPIKRSQLAQVFKDHETIVAFEAMVQDLMVGVPGAVNTNADEIDEIREQQDSVSAIVARVMEIAVRAQAIADENALLSCAINQLNARVTRLERSVSDLQQAPL
jgi:hypothetical protein